MDTSFRSLSLLVFTTGWAACTAVRQVRPGLLVEHPDGERITLIEVATFGTPDSLPTDDLHSLEMPIAGVVARDQVAVLDVGAARVLRLRVGRSGAFRGARAAGRPGRRVVGRFVTPCCLAYDAAGELTVLDLSVRSATRFSRTLRPIGRTSVAPLPVRARETGGLVRDQDLRGWLLAVEEDTANAIVRISNDWAEASILVTLLSMERPGAGQGPLSAPPLIALSNGGYVAGSGRSPVMTRLSDLGAILWQRELRVPEVPDPLPAEAPASLKQAPFRVSSLVELPDGRYLATLFRPARRHTVLAFIAPEGTQLQTAVYPLPLALLGITCHGYVVGLREQRFPQLVTFRLGHGEASQ